MAVMKFSPCFFWAVYGSCSPTQRHVWMRIQHGMAPTSRGSINSYSNVFFCLGTRRALDLQAISQTFFHTLHVSLAFSGEQVGASWFQVRMKQKFLFFWGQCDYFCYTLGAQSKEMVRLVCFVIPSNYSAYLPCY